MKKLSIATVLLFSSCGFLAADDCCVPRSVVQGRTMHFHYVAPREVLHGTACYIGGVGHRVLHGVGAVITAPFTTPCRVPVYRRTYRYIPPRYIPGRMYEVQEVIPTPAPPASEYFPVPMPHRNPIATSIASVLKKS
jgi:hypothetical protein